VAMFNSQKLLEKYGWKEGSGLGRNEDGISEPIKVKLKNNNLGIGYNLGQDLTWWSSMYDNVISNISVSNDDDGVKVKVSKKKSKSKKKRPLYGKFLTGSKDACDDSEDSKKSLETSQVLHQTLRYSKYCKRGIGKVMRVERQEMNKD
jgi:hypothetical protein